MRIDVGHALRISKRSDLDLVYERIDIYGDN